MVDKLAPVAGGIAETLVGDKFKNKVSEIKDTVFTDPILIADIENLLLNEFGDEPFYNDLYYQLVSYTILISALVLMVGKSTYLNTKELFLKRNFYPFLMQNFP